MKKSYKTATLLLLFGLAPIATALAQSPRNDRTMRETRRHCKFIDHRSKIVIHHQDTLQVYGIDTIYEDGQAKIVCDLGPGQDKLIGNFHYYQNTPWLPPFQENDTTAIIMALTDAKLSYMYEIYQTQDDDRRCDSIEKLIYDNRLRLIHHAAQHKK